MGMLRLVMLGVTSTITYGSIISGIRNVNVQLISLILCGVNVMTKLHILVKTDEVIVYSRVATSTKTRRIYKHQSKKLQSQLEYINGRQTQVEMYEVNEDELT